ncbi:MAG: hypothetical protein QW590_01530 [Candidatus Bilamarchaeaceae archaeon]
MYPEETITTTSKGEKEARILLYQGRVIVYKYKKLDGTEIKGKYSILIIPEGGQKERLMIVQTGAGKEMIVNKTNIPGKMAFYNEKHKTVVWV